MARIPRSRGRTPAGSVEKRRQLPPKEFTQAQPLERHSAESKRRQVAASGVGYSVAGHAAGLGSAGVLAARAAGTTTGQHALSGLTAAKYPGAAQLSRAGKIAVKRPIAAAAGTAGLGATSLGLNTVARMRRNEEQGISQGIGRIKASESFDRRQERLSKSAYSAVRGAERAGRKTRSALASEDLKTALRADTGRLSGRAQTASGWAKEHKNRLLIGTSAATAGVGSYKASASISSRRRQRDQLRELTKRDGAKRPPAVNREVLARNFGSPGRAARTLGRNPMSVAAGAALAGGAALQAPGVKRRVPERIRPATDRTTAGVAGAAAGHGAFLGAGYSIRAKGHALERTRPEGMSRSKHEKIMRQHAHSVGLSRNEKPSGRKAVQFNRTYPADLPAAKYKRFLGTHMSGKRGLLLNAAAAGVPAGAAVGAQSALGRKQRPEPVGKVYAEARSATPAELALYNSGRRRRKRVSQGWMYRDDNMTSPGETRFVNNPGNLGQARRVSSFSIGKALYQRESRRDPLRTVGQLAGLGITAAGLGRSKMVGRALAHGSRRAVTSGNAAAFEALQRASQLQGALLRGTAPGVRTARQIREVDDLIRRVPASMRGDVAAAAGIMLTSTSSPSSRTNYRPVSHPVRY